MAISIYPETVPVVIKDPVTETYIRLIPFPPEISQLRQYIREIEPAYDESDNLVLDYLIDKRYESLTNLTLDTANRALKVSLPWEEMASTPFTSSFRAFLIVEDYGYLPYGNQLWRYDILNDVWTRMADIPFTPSGGFGMCYNGIDWIYIIENNSVDNSKFARYSISQNTWTLRATYPNVDGRCLGYDPINARVYCIKGRYERTVYYYRENTNQWYSAPATPEPLRVPQSTMKPINGKFYLIIDDFRNHFYSFNLISGTWTRLSDFPGNTEYKPIVAVLDNDYIIANPGLGTNTDKIFLYIISKNVWIEFLLTPFSLNHPNGFDQWNGYIYLSPGTNTNKLYRVKLTDIETEYISKTRLLLDKYRECYVVVRNMAWHSNNNLIPNCQISYDDGITWLDMTLLNTDKFTSPNTNIPVENWFYRKEDTLTQIGSKFKIKLNLTIPDLIHPLVYPVYKNLIGAMLLK